jgi:hypothetical protein
MKIATAHRIVRAHCIKEQALEKRFVYQLARRFSARLINAPNEHGLIARSEHFHAGESVYRI